MPVVLVQRPSSSSRHEYPDSPACLIHISFGRALAKKSFIGTFQLVTSSMASAWAATGVTWVLIRFYTVMAGTLGLGRVWVPCLIDLGSRLARTEREDIACNASLAAEPCPACSERDSA